MLSSILPEGIVQSVLNQQPPEISVVYPGEGFWGLDPPFFWTINPFKWRHIVGTIHIILGWKPLLFPFFLKWLDPTLNLVLTLAKWTV